MLVHNAGLLEIFTTNDRSTEWNFADIGTKSSPF